MNKSLKDYYYTNIAGVNLTEKLYVYEKGKKIIMKVYQNLILVKHFCLQTLLIKIHKDYIIVYKWNGNKQMYLFNSKT